MFPHVPSLRALLLGVVLALAGGCTQSAPSPGPEAAASAEEDGGPGY